MEQDDEEPRDAPAFDLYCERWTHGTRHMTKVERCDYLDLLLHQWTEDGLPADLDMLARLVGYRKGSQISPLVLEKLPIAADGKRRNARLERERVKQRVRIRGKKKGAALTNAKRWGKRGGAGALPPDRDASWIESPGDADNESHSVSLSDPSATLERDDSDSPPPTTHHPPQAYTHTQRAGAPEGMSGNGSEQPENEADASHPTDSEIPPWFPDTVDKAVAACATFPVPTEYVKSVWLQLVGREFTDGAGRYVTRFGHYVASRWPKEKARWELDQRDGIARASGAPGVPRRGGTSQRDERGQLPGEIPTDVSVDKIPRI